MLWLLKRWGMAPNVPVEVTKCLSVLARFLYIWEVVGRGEVEATYCLPTVNCADLNGASCAQVNSWSPR